MDNVAFHKTVLIQELFNRFEMTHPTTHLRIKHVAKYLPPYSPFFNIAEYCFSCWKAHIRYYQFVHRVQLSAIIYETRACITPAKCFRWFQNTWKYYGPCFRKEMILN